MQLACAWWLCRASTRQARRQPDARRFALVRANRVARADLDGDSWLRSWASLMRGPQPRIFSGALTPFALQTHAHAQGR